MDGDTTRFSCPFCRAEFRALKTQTYATCPYCGTTFRVDNPDAAVEHYIFAIHYDKNSAYRLVKEFALMQIGVAEDFESSSEFESSYLYFIPLYIYDVSVRVRCRGGREEAGEGRIEISVHGGEEAAHIVTPAAENLPLKIPPGYSFPARGRRFFKPSVLGEGVYLQPSLDPEAVFARVKEPYVSKAVAEAATSCGGGYDLIDSSRYVGVAHYPFWLVKYRYRGRTHTSIVDASDGTILHLEYPLSLKSRAVGLVGGVLAVLIAGAVGGLITAALLGSSIYGFIGGATSSLPALAVALERFTRSRGLYRYNPSEEAVFAPVR